MFLYKPEQACCLNECLTGHMVGAPKLINRMPKHKSSEVSYMSRQHQVSIKDGHGVYVGIMRLPLTLTAVPILTAPTQHVSKGTESFLLHACNRKTVIEAACSTEPCCDTSVMPNSTYRKDFYSTEHVFTISNLQLPSNLQGQCVQH